MFYFKLTLLSLYVLNNCIRSDDICQKDYRYCGENDPVKCVPIDWWCDGHADCDSGMDEKVCPITECHQTEIPCSTGTQCIPKFLRCDGVAQCLDGSDEDQCGVSKFKTCDSLSQFDCNSDGEQCISLSLVCDGRNDCGRNQDEQPGGSLANCQRNDCRLTMNGGCSHMCTNLFTRKVCHCPDGYRLLDDTKTCQDIDECKLHKNKCTQICNNTDGSYQCLCNEGYKINPKVPGQCIVADGDRFVLVTLEDGEVVTMDLDNNVNIVHNVTSPSNSWANIDIDVTESSNTIIYWSNMRNSNIGSTVIRRNPGNSDKFDVISHSSIFKLHAESFCVGVTIDWLRSLLFWTNAEEAIMYVTNTTSNMSSILLTKDLINPRSIAVDPFETRLYWIDWGNKSSSPRIETMLTNTKGRYIIVKNGLRQPQGIALDFLDHRLYWSDVSPGSIVFIDLNRPFIIKTVISNKLLHPFSISIFENKVFWSDWRRNQVISVGKTVGDSMHLSVRIDKLSKPMSIRGLNRLSNPQLPSNNTQTHTCLRTSSHRCSDICIPSPPSDNRHPPSVTCLCAIGKYLSSDKETCITGSSSLVLPNNINRFKIIAAVMISLVVIVLLSMIIILLYLCRDRLCTRSSKGMSQHGVKHPIITGDLMFIFKCQSHSSQLSELLGNDYNSSNNA